MKKIKINLSVDEALWKAFRQACHDHNFSASQLFTFCMQLQLKQWQDAKEKPPHA